MLVPTATPVRPTHSRHLAVPTRFDRWEPPGEACRNDGQRLMDTTRIPNNHDPTDGTRRLNNLSPLPRQSQATGPQGNLAGGDRLRPLDSVVHRQPTVR